MAYSLLLWVHILAAAAAIGTAAFFALGFSKVAASVSNSESTKLKLTAALETGRWVSRCTLLILATGLGLGAYWWRTISAAGPSFYGYLLIGKFVMLLAISAIAGIHTAKARKALDGKSDAAKALATGTKLRAVALTCGLLAVMFGVMMRGM